MPINTCRDCKKTFNVQRARALYRCAPCFLEEERQYTRAHAATFSYERRRAHTLVGCAIAKGEMLRKPCEQCGSTVNVVAHHDDYAKPLDVRWLCKSHHRRHHIKFGPGLNAFLKETSA